jgi:hypothetical protein
MPWAPTRSLPFPCAATRWPAPARRVDRRAAGVSRHSAARAGSAQAAAGAEAAGAFDEGRFGLRVWLRRRWCPRRARPPWAVDDRYRWLWLYATVEPATGEGVFLLLPGVDQARFRRFLDEFAKELGEGRRPVARRGRCAPGLLFAAREVAVGLLRVGSGDL